MRIRASESRASQTMGNSGGFDRPLSGESFGDSGRDAAQGFSPFGCLGNSIFFTQNIVLAFLKTDSMGLKVFFIIGIFGDPGVSNGQLQGSVRIGEYGYPLISMDGGSIV